MDLITGASSDQREEPDPVPEPASEYVEGDATPGGTPIPQLQGPAAEPVEPIRAGAGAGRWAVRAVPAAVAGAAAVTWAVLRARRR